MADVGHNPARIIPAWREFADANPGPVRGIGEPIWAGRSETELVECQLHEALLNIAFADRSDFRLLCPYDTDIARPASVIHEACCSHPLVDGEPSHAFRDAARLLAPFDSPLPPPPADRADPRLRARHARRGAAPGRAQRAPRRPGGKRASRTSCWPSASSPRTASATAAGAGSCASGAPTTRSSARSATGAGSPIRSSAGSSPAIDQLDRPRAVDGQRGLRPGPDPRRRRSAPT